MMHINGVTWARSVMWTAMWLHTSSGTAASPDTAAPDLAKTRSVYYSCLAQYESRLMMGDVSIRRVDGKGPFGLPPVRK